MNLDLKSNNGGILRETVLKSLQKISYAYKTLKNFKTAFQ